jgi:tRNA(Ile)-lysidine synthase
MPDASKHMAETALRVAEAEAIYREAIAKRKSKLMEQRGKDWYIPVRLLAKQQQLQTIAYELFRDFGYSPEQIPHVLRLMESEGGKLISSATHKIIKHGDFLVVTAGMADAVDLIIIDEIPLEITTVDGSYSFSWTTKKDFIDDPNTVLLDGDELQVPLVLRTKKEGDYFYPLGMGGKKKKLKRFLIDIKVPVHEKNRVRILEWDKKILWITGKRIDERFKVRESTKRVLKVVYKPT